VEAAGAVGTVKLLAVVLVAVGSENLAYQDVKHSVMSRNLVN
jgi:hypothetical protein